MRNQNRNKVGLDFFLQRTEELFWSPSFYCSRAYLKAVHPDIVVKDGWMTLWDNDVCMFPPIPMDDGVQFRANYTNWPDYIWSDMEGFRPPPEYVREQLDLQYLYNPMEFFNMEGSRWATFRKNSKKWERRNWSPLFIHPWEVCPQGELAAFVGNWLESKADVFQDADVMLSYLFQSKGKDIQKNVVMDRHRRIMAIVAYDTNWKYVNFRYCITRPGEPFLEEAIRLKFYTEVMFGICVLVNDGGVVDNPQLEWFKNRLNPVEIKTTYSWRRANE